MITLKILPTTSKMSKSGARKCDKWPRKIDREQRKLSNRLIPKYEYWESLGFGGGWGGGVIGVLFGRSVRNALYIEAKMDYYEQAINASRALINSYKSQQTTDWDRDTARLEELTNGYQQR